MSPLLSDHSKQLLSQSLPLVQANKHEMIDRMQAVLALAEPDRDRGQAEINAMILVQMLINQVSHILATGEYDDLVHIPAEHTMLKITGRTYSRFGDALAPILKDVLGVNLPGTVSGAWVDSFWSISGKRPPSRFAKPPEGGQPAAGTGPRRSARRLPDHIADRPTGLENSYLTTASKPANANFTRRSLTSRKSSRLSVSPVTRPTRRAECSEQASIIIPIMKR